jgi:hypothetical protein
MQNVNHMQGSRVARPARLAAVGAAAAIAIFGAAAAQADAAQPVKAKLKHGALLVDGSKASDAIAVRLASGDSSVLEVDVDNDGSADASFARAQVAAIVIAAGGGNDLVRIDEGNGAVNDGVPTVIAGGDGDDTIAGGSGAETLVGGDGNDSIDGNRGADIGLMGAGDDTFIWDPGDGSDVVEGEDGADTMVFNGSGLAEIFDLSANGSRLKFTRNLGNITMDTAGVEQVDLNALGGEDLTTIHDLSATDVTGVNVDLASTLGGATGDNAADRVVVEGTNGIDAIDVSGSSAQVKVAGLAATTNVLHSELANDRLDIDTRAGDDTVTFGALDAGAIQLFVDGLQKP